MTEMNLSLEALRVLDAIDRKGSFAAAAVELDRVPSALTYMVRKLEDDLDVLLFDRTGHRAKLTPAGVELLQEGRHLLRSAAELEQRVRRIATGWEVELRIAVDDILCMAPILDLVGRFYEQQSGTRLRLFREVLSGSWDALVSGRAELAIGAPEAPSVMAGYQSRRIGEIETVFAVAPGHALAEADEPLPMSLLRQHRALAVGDTSRSLPAVTIGLLFGQDVLTLPSMQAKLDAHIAGLGCGYLPLGMAASHIEAGRLVAKLTVEPRWALPLHYAWRSDGRGKALRWFLQELEDPALRKALLP